MFTDYDRLVFPCYLERLKCFLVLVAKCVKWYISNLMYSRAQALRQFCQLKVSCFNQPNAEVVVLILGGMNYIGPVSLKRPVRGVAVLQAELIS